MVSSRCTVLPFSFQLQRTAIQVVLGGFLLGSLVSSLILVPLLRFKIERPIGIYLGVYYLTFLTVALLTETEVIFQDFAR